MTRMVSRPPSGMPDPERLRILALSVTPRVTSVHGEVRPPTTRREDAAPQRNRLRDDDCDRNRVSGARVADGVAVDDIDAGPGQLRREQCGQHVFTGLSVTDVGRAE